MINVIKKEVVNRISVILFQVGKSKFSVSYFADESSLSELEQRQYNRWANFKDRNSLPEWVGRPETEMQAKSRFNQMVELLRNNQVKIKQN